MTRVIICALLLPLAGCAGVSHAMQYAGTTIVRVETDDDVYRIYDKPDEGRLMITPSIGRAAADGFVRGGTIGIVDSSSPKPFFRNAVEKHFARTGRTQCKITDGYVILHPQWEFTYTCH